MEEYQEYLECPEGTLRMDWEVSLDGETIPVETLPSKLSPWLRVARKWEKKFAVSFREAAAVAQAVVELFEGIPTPGQLRELEQSYPDWESLSQGVQTLAEAVAQPAVEPAEDIADWVLTHGNLSKLLALQEEGLNIEAEEYNRLEAGTCWRSLPLRSPSPKEDRAERRKVEGVITLRQVCLFHALAHAKALKTLISVFKKLRQENLPQYWKDKLFFWYKAKKEKLAMYQKEALKGKAKAAFECLDGKAFYSFLSQPCFSREEREKAWRAFKARKAVRDRETFEKALSLARAGKRDRLYEMAASLPAQMKTVLWQEYRRHRR